jgi:ligand-binding SRPBCC domain-containing protein
MRAEHWLDRIAWAPRAGDRPARGLVYLRAETIVAASLEETFAFFSNAANLERLTPPWLKFRIQTPMPVVMREGATIDYRIVIHGVPIPWRSRIELWEPDRRFVDRQLIGPYRWWRHEHLFEPAGSGTRVVDAVEFVPRLRWISRHLVQRDVERIFAFRQERLPQLLDRPTI